MTSLQDGNLLYRCVSSLHMLCTNVNQQEVAYSKVMSVAISLVQSELRIHDLWDT
jgi:hypothetical protein